MKRNFLLVFIVMNSNLVQARCNCHEELRKVPIPVVQPIPVPVMPFPDSIPVPVTIDPIIDLPPHPQPGFEPIPSPQPGPDIPTPTPDPDPVVDDYVVIAKKIGALGGLVILSVISGRKLFSWVVGDAMQGMTLDHERRLAVIEEWLRERANVQPVHNAGSQ